MPISSKYPVALVPVRLETRFTTTHLRVRIYPDQLSIDTHENELTAAEIAAGRRHREAANASPKDGRRAAWRELARRFGSSRASWIVRQVDHYDGQSIEAFDTAPWSLAPRATILPDRFVVTVFRGETPVYVVPGKPIGGAKAMMRSSKIAGSDLFDDESHWVVDFGRAVDEGMAIEIELLPGDRGDDVSFDRLVVVGLRSSDAPTSGARELEQLIEHHHYGEGIAFLPHGTPTNNTEATKSGYSESADDVERTYELEFGPNSVGMPAAQLQPNNAERLRLALGLDPGSGVLDRLDHATDDEAAGVGEFHTAIWPATGDQMLRFMLSGEAVSLAGRRQLWAHFREFVRASGPLPALRVGNLPYGVLPTTRIASSSEQASGWKASTEDAAVDADGDASRQFDSALHAVLTKLVARWRASLATPNAVPRIGDRDDDPDRELLEILGMRARSTSCVARPFVDERLISFVLYVLRVQLFGPGTAFSLAAPGTAVEQWARDWYEKWQDLQAVGAGLLQELGVAQNLVKEAPLLRGVGWGAGSPPPVPMVRDESGDNEGSYLQILSGLGRHAPEDGSSTILFDLLRRSLIWEYPLADDIEQAPLVHDAIRRLATIPILEFFNRARSAEDIVAGLRDDPSFPMSTPITEAAATKILERRDQGLGYFRSIDEIEATPGVSESTWHNILFSFQRNLDVAKQVVAFFNAAESVDEIRARIRDDGDFGAGVRGAGPGITREAAAAILKERNTTGEFNELSELHEIVSVGANTIHNILWTFRARPEASIDALAFLNAASSAREIADKVRDDPNFGPKEAPSSGTVDPDKAYGVRLKLATDILAVRDELGGVFSEVQQIDDVYGVGKETLGDIKAALGDEQAILDFFNSVTDPQVIVDTIPDDGGVVGAPSSTNSSDAALKEPRGLTLAVAQKILDERTRLGGYFDEIGQVWNVRGVGPDAIHDILYTFQVEAEEEEVVDTDAGDANDQADPVIEKILEFFNEVDSVDDVLAKVRDDPEYRPYEPPAPGITATVAARILEHREGLPGAAFEALAQIAEVDGVGPGTLHNILSSFWRRIVPDSECLLHDVLDLCTHRLDAWLTSLASKRLAAMRRREPEGIGIGAYGWVENLSRRQRASEGFIHAPSLGQASMAAVLRSAFSSHEQLGSTALHINLSSDRVHRAMRIIEGVRSGQELGALLGQLFERGLHDRGKDLEQYVDEFREAFPARLVETPSANPPGAQEIAAREVVDGLALVNAWRESDDRDPAAIVPGLPSSGGDHGDLADELDLLADAHDAVSDALLAEGVFHTVQGNFDRGSAALDAAAGKGRPPEIESMQTRVRGALLEHRLCVLFDASASPTLDPSGPRARAEPRLNDWAGTILGPLSAISCTAYFDTEAGDRASRAVTLDQLRLDPIDLLYLASVPPSGEGLDPAAFVDLADMPRAGQETEVERRISLLVRRSEGLGATVSVRIDSARGAGGGARGLAETLELARRLLSLVTRGTPLRTRTLVRSEDEQPSASVDVAELRARAKALRKDLKNAGKALAKADDPDELSDALLKAAGFGIAAAVPSAPDDAGMAATVARVSAELDERREECEALLGEPEDASEDREVERLRGAIEAGLGRGFLVMPAVYVPTTPASSAVLEAFGELDAAGPDPVARIQLWLQQMAEIRPSVRLLDDLVSVVDLVAGVGETPASDGLRVAQLPYIPGHAWRGLSDREIADAGLGGGSAAAGRARGGLSIVALVPGAMPTSLVTGFVVDEWSEKIPEKKVTSGVSFHFDQPNSQAPHAILLAVPPDVDTAASWSEELLTEIALDTLELSKLRLVDLDALQGVGTLFPALFMSANPRNPGWKREAIESIESWIGQRGG